MANVQAFETGYQQGKQQTDESRARKQAMSDELLHIKVNELVQDRLLLEDKLTQLKDKDGKPLPGFDETQKALESNYHDLRETLHPDTNPGAIQKFGHIITDALHITKPMPTGTMVIPKPRGLVEAGNIPIWNRPKIDNGDGTISSEYSVSFTKHDDGKGHEVLVPTVVDGKFLTPDGKKPQPGSPEEKAMFEEAWKHYEQTGQHLGKFENDKSADEYATILHNRHTPPKFIQKQIAGDAQDAAQAQARAAALPPSAVQQAAQQVDTDAMTKLATLNANMASWKKANADQGIQTTPDEERAFFQDQVEKIWGTTTTGTFKNVAGKLNGKPTTLLQNTKDGKYYYENRQPVSPDVLETGDWTPDVNQTADTKKRADWQAAKDEFEAKNPGKEFPNFEQWVPLQTATGRAAAPKPETLDTQYKAALVKQKMGQPLTKDEEARMAAWQEYNYETKTEPGVKRMQALAEYRYIPVINPQNPEEVVMMHASDAEKAQVGTPASIAFQNDKTMTRLFTSGQAATTINYFTTAIDHLKLLAQAADALKNGNLTVFNKFANDWASATGNPAPNNFDTVRNAVAGELSKTFKGTGATDQEIENISGTINSAQSPDQLAGGIDYDLRLMQGKMGALRGQYEKGMSKDGKPGTPNFPAQPGATPSGGGAPKGGKGSRSLKAAMALPVNKGKSAAAVAKHLTELGYTVTTP